VVCKQLRLDTVSRYSNGLFQMTVRFLKYWLPVLAWMLFIFIGSTDLLSAEHTSRFIGPFLRWFAPDVSNATIATAQLVVRKFGHFTEYAILAALLYRAWRRHRERALALSIIAAGIYAPLHEFHQSFIASRTGSPWDVAVDCLGALAGLALSLAYRNRKSKIQNRK
jgi:VanZ family protein